MTEANRAAILAILGVGLGAYAWHVGTLEHSGAVVGLLILGVALVGVGVAVVQP